MRLLFPMLLRALLLPPFTLGACSAARGPYTTPDASTRDTRRAQELSREAALAIDKGDYPVAERLLREALGHDLYFGPAHNNLGVVHLKQARLYEAASEFEWARKLMPGHPDPRINLALVLEQVGKTDDAIEAYAAALDVYPDHLGAMQGLARLRVRSGLSDDSTRAMLSEIALRSDSQEWRTWAHIQMGKLGGGGAATRPRTTSP
ncbi:MAG TPA: tetratricopeptide repeat protein [Phycisphaerales bacterium]|nr:tetratricopeptide repeat protein [Phycisphaerales bacterium]